MKSALEYVTNIAIVVVCVLLAWFFIKNHNLILHDKTSQAVDFDLTGTRLAPVPEYPWNTHAKTLVMGLQLGCRYCEASEPFYKRLSALQQAKRLHAYLLAYMPDQNAAATRQLQSNGIAVACACGHPLSSIHVSVTPTLLLVDAQGRVERTWIGQLASEQENEVVAELEK